MDLVLSLEHRFYKTKDGNYYSSSQSVGYHLWSRYLAFFDRIIVVARVKKVDYKIDEKFLVSHPNVSFLEIPYYEGPFQYLKKRLLIKEIIDKFISTDNAYLCRVPSRIGSLIINALKRKKIKYGVEVVGDPWDAFSFIATKSIVSQFFRIKARLSLEYCVKNAEISLFVTERTLQKRYKPVNARFSIGVSDVVVPDKNFLYNSYLNRVHDFKHSFNLLAVGSLAQMYKAPDVVLCTIKKLVSNDIKCNLVWLGDGKYLKRMKELSIQLELCNNVKFMGNVPSDEVNEYMNNADLFIHVSKTEGLPRVIVEAMSLGLPCIGSNVGGIPELLSQSMLVKPGSVNELYNKICEFYNLDNNEIKRISSSNFEQSKLFQKDLLDYKRNTFLNKLKMLYEKDTNSTF